MASLVSAIADVLARSGVDLAALGLAWARAVPAVTMVPAFGLRALPAPARAVLGLALAASIFPALTPVAVGADSRPWILLALVEVARGLPVAISAAVPLWAATMAGGVADALRGSQDTMSAPTVEGRIAFSASRSLLALCSVLTLRRARARGCRARGRSRRNEGHGRAGHGRRERLDRRHCPRDRPRRTVARGLGGRGNHRSPGSHGRRPPPRFTLSWRRCARSGPSS